MEDRPIIILGAGATKACGGPLTDEILPAALNGEMAHDDQRTLVADREELLDLVRNFLRESFNVPLDDGPVRKEDCPSLPMVLSMLRRSILQDLPIGGWAGDRLIKAKRAIEYAVFAVIEAALRRIPPDRRFHRALLEPLYQSGIEPVAVSLNYDVITDNAMFSLCEQYQQRHPPDYRVEISTERYAEFCSEGMYGRLLKIHGSLNWLYCEHCKRLDLFVSEGMRTGKALNGLVRLRPLRRCVQLRGTPCRNRPRCDGFVGPILITPTYVRDYENPHIDRVWAEHAMKETDRAVIIGYSLPTDDVEVAMLFKRGLEHLPRDRITVVEHVRDDINKPADRRTPLEQHPTGQRFRSLFGGRHRLAFRGFRGVAQRSERCRTVSVCLVLRKHIRVNSYDSQKSVRDNHGQPPILPFSRFQITKYPKASGRQLSNRNCSFPPLRPQAKQIQHNLRRSAAKLAQIPAFP